MQILAIVGYEFENRWVGLIDGEVRLMQCKSSVPHIDGRVQQVCESPLFSGISETEEFYFMHFMSFRTIRTWQHCLAMVNISSLPLSRGARRPVPSGEKSRYGHKITRNFVEL